MRNGYRGILQLFLLALYIFSIAVPLHIWMGELPVTHKVQVSMGGLILLIITVILQRFTITKS